MLREKVICLLPRSILSKALPAVVLGVPAQGLGAGSEVSVLGTGAGVLFAPRRSWKGFGPPIAFRTGSCTSRYIRCRMFMPPEEEDSDD